MKKKLIHPLMAWDIIAERQVQPAGEKVTKKLLELKKRYQWNVNVQSIMKNEFDTIVVTDKEQIILWASEGFERMTGYKPSFAKNKKPSFLQGPDTETEVKQQIRQAIQQRQPVKATLTNYRKDGTPYQCQVEITPIYNFENILTHFMALELYVTE